MKSFVNLLLIGLVTMSSIGLISCCKPEGYADKDHHHGHSKMHHEHGDK